MASTAPTGPVQANASLDLRGTPCPLNFVRAKLRLAKLAPGQLLEILLDGGEPLEQVPSGLAEAGHGIERLDLREDFCVLLVRCGAHEAP
jgi:tRNA 2-thiouridine synthesizing protein A